MLNVKCNHTVKDQKILPLSDYFGSVTSRNKYRKLAEMSVYKIPHTTLRSCFQAKSIF